MKPLYGKFVDLSFDQTLAKTELALGKEGFGILCHIDVSRKLEEKLGVEMPPYRILGACLPAMAHRAISAEPEIGIMLPCNVVVREVEGGTRVEVVNTEAMVELFPGVDELKPVADEVGARLESVLQSI